MRPKATTSFQRGSSRSQTAANTPKPVEGRGALGSTACCHRAEGSALNEVEPGGLKEERSAVAGHRTASVR
jgi:hypothetical protein